MLYCSHSLLGVIHHHAEIVICSCFLRFLRMDVPCYSTNENESSDSTSDNDSSGSTIFLNFSEVSILTGNGVIVRCSSNFLCFQSFSKSNTISSCFSGCGAFCCNLFCFGCCNGGGSSFLVLLKFGKLSFCFFFRFTLICF